MIINKNGLSVKKYLKLEETFNNKIQNYDIEKIEFLIEDSINKRHLSEVPLGTLNSGGLDSSLISFYASNHFQNTLKTFSVAPNLNNGEILDSDESIYAEKLACSIKSCHNTIRYSEKDFFDLLDSSIYYNDGLLFYSNSVPMSIMFNVIKNQHNTTVLLSGEGADEIFRGYSINRLFALYKLSKKTQITYRICKNQLVKKYPKLASSEIIKQYSFILKLILLNKSHFNETNANLLLIINGTISEDRLKLLENLKQLTEEDQMICYDQTCYLSGLLQRVDRMSMRWGIEVRVPFLDHRIVEYVNTILLHQKAGTSEKSVKKILKYIAKNKILKEIILRKKYGFASPLNTYRPLFINKFNKQIPSGIYKNMSDQEIFLTYNKLKMKDIYYEKGKYFN